MGARSHAIWVLIGMATACAGKLKDLGNTVLGKFGMSLDNFKMVQQPDGTYSVNFQQ
jgi:hypothetical protein